MLRRAALVMGAVAMTACSPAVAAKGATNSAGVSGIVFDGPKAGVGGRPVALAATPDAVWAAQAGAGTVTRVGASSHRAVGDAVTVGRAPYSVHYAFGRVWVATFRDDTLVALDAAAGKRVSATTVPDRPFGVTDGFGALWVGGISRGTVTRVDPSTNAVVGEPTVIEGVPHGLAAGSAYIWVVDIRDNEVLRIRPSDGHLVGAPIPVGALPDAIAIRNGVVWVTCARYGTVVRLSEATGERLGRPTRVPARPQAIAVDDNAAWVVSLDGDALTRIDAATGHASRPVLIGDGPTDVVSTPTGVWVANSKDDQVARYAPQ